MLALQVLARMLRNYLRPCSACRYVVYGALSPASGISEIMQELVTLAENAIDLLQTFEDYLA